MAGMEDQSKSEGAKLGYKRLETVYPFVTKWLRLRQDRYPVDEWCYGVAAGGTHDRGDDALEEVARDELHEELGASCEELIEVSSFYASPGRSGETCHVFLALGVKLDGNPMLEETEH